MTDQIRIDEELGPVRWCRRCAEWWPDDAEFWRYATYHIGDVGVANGKPYTRRTDGLAATCRSCHSYLQVAHHIERRKRQGVTHHRCRSRSCIVIVPVGRAKCHGCTTGTVGPLTVQFLTDVVGMKRFSRLGSKVL